MGYFIDEFQEQIWNDKYRYKNETYEKYCHRIAYNIFEKDDEIIYRDALYDRLLNFEVLFGGRINSNIGIEEDGLTLFNCFIEPIPLKDADSLESIFDVITKYALTLKTEGGVGFCCNFLRPAKTLIRKIGVTTPGAIKFLEIFDKVSDVITSGDVEKKSAKQGVPFKNTIRKGATMVTMSVCHPDIKEFINAKTSPNRLTKMNMSVLVTDAFIQAVHDDMNWDLWFPDINFEKYSSEWNGDFEKWAEKGYPYVIYETLKAVELWDLLLLNTYNRNEPGIIFIDTVRKMDNLWYLEHSAIMGPNPCFTKKMRLFTDKGMLRFSDLYNSGECNNVIVDNRQMDKNNYGTSSLPASKVYKTGNNVTVYKVETKAGYELEVTDYHPIDTTKGRIQLRDLCVGDKLLINSGCGGFGDVGTYEIGRLVGLITGDGTVFKGWDSKNNCSNNKIFVRLWGKDNILIHDIEADVNKLIENYKVGGALYTVKYKYIEAADECEVASSVLYRVFNDMGLINMKEEVPDYIFRSSEECVIGYLRGFFQADGTVGSNESSKTCSVRLGNIKLQLLKGVQILLSNFGILSRIYFRKEKGYRRLPDGKGGYKDYFCKDFYELIIDGEYRDVFMSKIGFLLDYKNDKYNNWVKDKKLLKKGKFVDVVASIEKCGKEDVFCLKEPHYNSIVVNGILTGQCNEIFGSTGMVEYDNDLILIGDVCNLGSINITKFYGTECGVFDYCGFLEAGELLVRALDNVIDISNYPLEIYEVGAELKRKIGVGIAGVGSLMMMMGIEYGGKQCIEFLDDLLPKFMNTLYKASAQIAKEKGPFKIYDEKIMEGGYIKNSGVLHEDTLKLIKKYGIRNSALAAIAPNGSLSIVAGNISGGLEPVFAKEFYRWGRVEGKRCSFRYPNVHKSEWFETDYFKEDTVADETVLISTDGNYRIDKNTGLCKKVFLMDYGYKVAKEKSKDLKGAMELPIENHLNVLKSFVVIDQSMSKTINLSSDTSFDEFKQVYTNLHKYGVKGCTTYREGTSVCILEVDKQEKTVKEQQEEFLEVFKNQKTDDVIAKDVKLPAEYPAKGYILKSEGKKWYIHVAFKDESLRKPFAIFVNTNNKEDNVLTFNAIDKLEELALEEGLRSDMLDIVKKKYSYQKNPVKICRMLGFLLRHNVKVVNIVKTLDSVDDAVPGTFIFRIKKFLSQFILDYTLQKPCPECGKKTLIYTEGCTKCTECGSSRCE